MSQIPRQIVDMVRGKITLSEADQLEAAIEEALAEHVQRGRDQVLNRLVAEQLKHIDCEVAGPVIAAFRRPE